MILTILIWAALAIGLSFNTLGIVGILRFPDVYTRLHADTKCTTFGTIFIALAVVLYALRAYVQTTDGQYVALIFHTLLAVVVLAFTNATSAHAIAQAAHRRGHKPVQAVTDRLEEPRP